MEILITLKKKKLHRWNNQALFPLPFTDQNLSHKEVHTCKLYNYFHQQKFTRLKIVNI